MINPFFKNTGPHNINFLLKHINLNNDNLPDDKITDIKDLNSSEKSEITFLHSKKYTDLAKKTKASYCLTTENFQSFLPIFTLSPIRTFFPNLTFPLNSVSFISLTVLS